MDRHRYLCEVDQGSEQAPAGWYPDPHSPDRMRYFDGEAWTNHFHQPGRLPDIGSWLNTTFSVFGRYWQSAAFMALGISLIGGAGVWLALRVLVADVAIVDEEVVNLGAGTVFAGLLVIAFAFIWQGFGWLAMSRFMHRAHFQADPTVSDALAHALQRLPRYLGVIVVLALAAVLIMVIVAFLVVAVPALGVVALLAMAVVLVWLFVKLGFLFTAIAVAPAGTPVIQASAGVSSGRFWGVLGRLVLITIGVALVGQIVAVGLGDYGQYIDGDVLSNVVQVRGDTVIVRDFRVIDLLPSTGQFIVAIIVNSIVQGASAMVSTSALTRLYLDSGAPAQI